MEPTPTWTRLDTVSNLVASYTIDRGRQFELDRTDGGRATVQINDPTGILDPTNTGGPYYGKIEPLIQIALGRHNPVLNTWHTRFRGFIAEYDYDFDPSQRVNRLTLECLDIFEILGAIDMLPGDFGDSGGRAGYVFFDNANVDSRIIQVLGNAGIPTALYVVFSGNVDLHETTYSRGETALTAIQEAADAEFPGVSNLYPDRFGRIVFHGRLAKFDPTGTIAAGGPIPDSVWDWHHWKSGDGAAVNASPSDTAQIRVFAMNRGLSKVINSAVATPIGILDADVTAQIVQDAVSIALRGIRSWSSENLLTKTGLLDSSDDLTETQRFASYYVNNYAAPRNRITALGLRSMKPGWNGAARTWRVLCESDISDQIDVTVAAPGGGGFTLEPGFIEGIHEESRPLNASYDDVTMSLDVSPTAYFTENPFPTS